MPTPKCLYLILATLALANLILDVTATDLRAWNKSLEARYTRAHSLGDHYEFNSKDGWQTVNASSVHSRHSRSLSDGNGYSFSSNSTTTHSLIRRSGKQAHNSKVAQVRKTSTTNKAKAVVEKSQSKLKAVMNGLKGIGKSELVKITWYTGHDLLNPSCWSNPRWAPSDESFAAALTLEGWVGHPECLSFLELCNGPKKCVFVRVVDSCAGCAKGSKHVDLTQAPFKQLADLDQGLLTVQMRKATNPEGWLEYLWGPRG